MGFSGAPVPSGTEEIINGGSILYPRSSAFGSSESGALTSGTVYLTYWIASISQVITKIKTSVGGTAAAGLTTATIGIYSIDVNNNLALIASIGNLAGTIWITPFNSYIEALNVPFVKQKGIRYAVGNLAIGATPPSLYGQQYNSVLGADAPILAGTFPGQASLPSFIASASVQNSFQICNLELLQ